jgi:transposase
MQPNATNGRQKLRSPAFRWTGKHEDAVALLWQGLAVEQVAARLGVHRATLWRWRSQPAFRECSAAYAATYRRAARQAAEREMLATISARRAIRTQRRRAG